MKTIYGTTDVEINGVQQIAAGGTGATTASAALAALGAPRSLSNVVSGTVVTGTLNNTASKALSIPANSFTTNDCPELIVRVRRTGASLTQFQTRIYWNTTPDIAGTPILIGRGPNVVAGSNTLYLSRLLAIVNSTNSTSVNDVTIQNTTDYGITTPIPQSLAIDWTQNGFIVVAIQNLSVSDQTYCDIIRIR